MEDEQSNELDNLSDEDLSSGALEGDNWIEELECALLADCDPATLEKISEGRRIPTTLRPDYWKALLSLNDAGQVKLNTEYDVENQLEIREDCEKLVVDIAKNSTSPLTEADILRLRSDFETIFTTYIKARPELHYVSGNGWTDILKVLHNLELNITLCYQMFFRIVDRYIPKDLFSQNLSKANAAATSQLSGKTEQPFDKKEDKPTKDTETKTKKDTHSTSAQESKLLTSSTTNTSGKDKDESIQAYHLLRLLIQYHDPELCSILDSKKIVPNLYVEDWFCSLFARSCSSKSALLIWDTHFKMADPFLIFFASIVMVVNASDELKNGNLSKTDILKLLKSMPSKLQEDDIEDLYYLVSHHYTFSTPRSIRSYSHLFFLDTFAKTYSGNDSPEEGQKVVDLKTTKLTSNLDLSQYLCLPVVPAEIFAIDTATQPTRNNTSGSSPTRSQPSLRYFLVDCRPAEQYNAGHLKKAFHLDCSLMLREPSSFSTAVQVLLDIQRQVVASKSTTGGQHLCFIGSGQEEEDQFVNMVVASFLQKYQKYVSIVVGGFDAIHDYAMTKSELKETFDKLVVDHNPELCKACNLRSPNGSNKPAKSQQSSSSGFSSAQSLFASTTSFLLGDKHGTGGGLSKLAANPEATANLIAQSGASMFDKLTTAFVSKSSEIKYRLVETLQTSGSIPMAAPNSTVVSSGELTNARGHVSSQDKQSRRYTGGGLTGLVRYAIDEDDDLNFGGSADGSGMSTMSAKGANSEPIQEIQIDTWQLLVKPLAFQKCTHIVGNLRYHGYIALTSSHLWILREIPHNKGFAGVAAKRALDTIVKITSKRRQPDMIIFRYTAQDLSESRADASGSPGGEESDQLNIPQPFELIRMIKREVVRILDEKSRQADLEAKALALLECADGKEIQESTTAENDKVIDEDKDKDTDKEPRKEANSKPKEVERLEEMRGEDQTAGKKVNEQ